MPVTMNFANGKDDAAGMEKGISPKASKIIP